MEIFLEAVEQFHVYKITGATVCGKEESKNRSLQNIHGANQQKQVWREGETDLCGFGLEFEDSSFRILHHRRRCATV